MPIREILAISHSRASSITRPSWNRWPMDRTSCPANMPTPRFPSSLDSHAVMNSTGDDRDRAAAEFFWDRVVHHHSYVTGGHCDHEHFGEPDKLNDRLSPITTETCNVYNMLKLTTHVFGWKPEADVADFYERALLNHIRSTQHPDGRVIYNLSLKPGHHKEYLPVDSFTCCSGTGFENHVKYSEANLFPQRGRIVGQSVHRIGSASGVSGRSHCVRKPAGRFPNRRS